MKTFATCMGIAFVSSLGVTSCDVPAENQTTPVAVEAALTACDASWTVADSPNVGGGDNLLASVSGARPDDVWAVGQFAPDANPDITLTLAEHFDGHAWSIVETPNVGTNHGNALLAVAALSGRAWAVGYEIGPDYLAHGLIEQWDGRAWSVVDHHQPFETGNLYGVAAVSPDDVWAVGSGRDGEGPFHAVALHFDGHRWRSIPPVDAGRNGNVLYSVAARSTDDVWAVGQQIGDEPSDRVLVEHWDGRRWSVVSVDAPGDSSKQLLAVDLIGRDDFRAVGDSQDGHVSLRTLAAIGERQALAVHDTPNPNVRDDRLTGLAAISDDQAIAVGSTLDDSSGGLQTLIVAGVEGGTWTRVASPNPSVDGDNQLATIAKVSGDLWAVGGYDGPDARQTLILHRCRR